MMDSKIEVKTLLSRRAMTMKELARRLSEESGKYYSPQNLSYRLSKNLLRLSEMDCICGILGYDIRFVDKN